jgi:hypothetical protein
MGATYPDLHDMLDRLTPDQAEAIRPVLREFTRTATETPHSVEATNGTERRLSFIGLIPDGPSDLAERSEDIIRARFTAP